MKKIRVFLVLPALLVAFQAYADLYVRVKTVDGRRVRFLLDQKTVERFKDVEAFIGLKESSPDLSDDEVVRTMVSEMYAEDLKILNAYLKRDTPNMSGFSGIENVLRLLRASTYLGIQGAIDDSLRSLSKTLFKSKKLAYFETKVAFENYCRHVLFDRGLSVAVAKLLGIPRHLSQRLSVIDPLYREKMGFIELQIAAFLLNNSAIAGTDAVAHLMDYVNSNPVLFQLHQKVAEPNRVRAERLRQQNAERKREREAEMTPFEKKYGRPPETPYEMLFDEIEVPKKPHVEEREAEMTPFEKKYGRPPETPYEMLFDELEVTSEPHVGEQRK